MSKNKIAKLLLALGIGVATAASGVAIAGCGNNTEPDDDEPGIVSPNPDGEEGENPGTGEGENPGTGEGENPGTGEGENPDTGEGENPGTGEGENPGTGEVEYEDITTDFDFASALSYGTYTGDLTIGKFTFEAGGRFETSSSNNCWNSQGNNIIIVLTGTENSITFDCARASSSGSTNVNLYKDSYATGNDITPADWTAAQPNVYSDYTVSGLSAGTYVLRTNPSGRIKTLSVTEKLPKGTPVSLTLQGGTADYLLGDEFVTTGITAMLNYDNGRKDVVAVTEFDTTAFKAATQPGVYTVGASYKLGDETYNGEYTVTLYAPETIELVTGNLNEKTSEVYKEGDKFNTSNISVTIVGKSGEDTHTFYKVGSKHYSLGAIEDTLTAGVKTLTVTSTANSSLTDSFTYYVIPELPITTKEVTVTVGNEFKNQAGSYAAESIQQAIDFLRAMNLGDAVVKNVVVPAGEYYEKVLIDVSNVVLQGAGGKAIDEAMSPTFKTLETKIWFDAINTDLDAAGNAWANDAINNTNATIVVTAPNVTIKNIYIENYWNDADKAAAHAGDDQALALFVWADMFTLENSALSSYQDTVQFKTGRQIVTDCYIEGVTDFIYGTNATVYFYNSTIYSKWRNHNTQGGYITAFKGTNNSDGSDAVEYGAVFDNCYFTADEREIA